MITAKKNGEYTYVYWPTVAEIKMLLVDEYEHPSTKLVIQHTHTFLGKYAGQNSYYLMVRAKNYTIVILLDLACFAVLMQEYNAINFLYQKHDTFIARTFTETEYYLQ